MTTPPVPLALTFEVIEMAFPWESNLMQFFARNWEGKLVGMITTEIEGSTFSFSRLYVVDEFRRRGIGSAIMLRVATAGRAFGCESLTGVVHPKNLSGMAFYRKLGLAPAYTFGDGDIIFTMKLA